MASVVGEFFKDVGRRVIGQGPEVDFKNQVQEYAKKHGVSTAEAQKDIFGGALADVQGELSLRGTIEPKSKEYRRFEAALHEVFGDAGVEQFKLDSSDPTKFRAVTPGVPNLKGAEAYFKSKYSKTPDMAVLRQCADNNLLLRQLFQRFSTDPNLRSSADLTALLSSHPELRADLGKIILTKDARDNRENRFGKEVKFDEEMKELKDKGGKALSEMLWKAPADWVSSMVGKGFSPSFKNFLSMCGDTAKFFGRELSAGAKLLYYSARTGVAHIRKKLA